MNNKIPPSILAAVAKTASEMFTRTEMCNAFEESGFPSGAGVGSSKLEAARAYLRTLAAHHNGWTLLERMIRRVMEEPHLGCDEPAAWAAIRGHVKEILAGAGYAYIAGKLVDHAPVAPARSLEEGIRRHDMQAVMDEFERALANVNADPPAAATAACAILESVFKTVLGDDGIPLPSDQSIGPLWKLLRDHLELAPEKALNDDLRPRRSPKADWQRSQVVLEHSAHAPDPPTDVAAMFFDLNHGMLGSLVMRPRLWPAS